MKSKVEKQHHPARLKKGKAAAERGFTLIETAIALLIMTVAALAATSLFFHATHNNSGANDRALALAIAQQQLEQLRELNFNDATLDAGTTETTVTMANRNYTVRRVVCAAAACGGSATLKRITLTVTPQGAGPQWVRTPVTVFTHRTSLATGAYID